MTSGSPSTAPRSALGGMCSLLVIGLLVAATLSGTDAGLRELSNDPAHQRQAVRHITETVVRAVRNLAGDRTRPGLALAAQGRASRNRPAQVIGSPTPPNLAVPRILLRAELLNLPPPPARA